jgi:hypothetical protein
VKKIKVKKTQQPAAVKSEPARPVIPPEASTLPASPDFESKLQESNPEAAKKGPGRPRKEELPAADQLTPLQLTDTAVKAAVKIPFSLWAEANKMPELGLLETEVAELSIAIKGLLDYYWPEMPTPLLLWANATLTLAAIVSPRLQRIQNIKDSRSEKKEQGPAKPNPLGRGGPSWPQSNYPTMELAFK